jgi:predicted DNA-binding transcriptional regulator AlpA
MEIEMTSTYVPAVLAGTSPPARIVLRKPGVLAATGWSNSTLYEKIAKGLFPKPTRLDPSGRCVVWFTDEVAEFQRLAVEAAK